MRKMRRLPLAVVAVMAAVAVIVLAACGGSSGGSGGGSGGGPATSAAAVTIQNFAFSPAKLTVTAGTTVTWTNKDGVTHDVTSAAGAGVNAKTTSLFASGPLGQGQTFSHTFAKKGDFFYECTVHRKLPAMHAEVVVK